MVLPSSINEIWVWVAVCADALEDAIRDALGGLSNNLGAKYRLEDLPLAKSIGKMVHHMGGAGKATG